MVIWGTAGVIMRKVHVKMKLNSRERVDSVKAERKDLFHGLRPEAESGPKKGQADP
jgi:hypothetical protein